MEKESEKAFIQETATKLGHVTGRTIRAVRGIGTGTAILFSGVLIASALFVYPYVNRFELTGSGFSGIIARLDRVTGEVLACIPEEVKHGDASKGIRYACNE